jgi:hypothetical protein
MEVDMIHWGFLILAFFIGVMTGAGVCYGLIYVVRATNRVIDSAEEFGAGR